MENINVDKSHLIEILRKNRDHHREIFLEAQVKYRELVIEELDTMLKDARDGKKIRRAVSLVEPQDHTKDYERVIGMLELSTDTIISLAEHDYQRFVLDNWAWKEQFLYANSSYSATASADYISLHGED